jgi:prepilin-type N-terminal cleavage/methylation domain-containing protein
VRGRAARPGIRAPASSGLTLVELVIVLAILSVALSVFSRTLVSSARLEPLNREAVIAAEAARGMLEELRSVPYEEIFVRYNDDPADDPAGPATAPGSRFAVEGLEPLDGEQTVGRVLFPVIDGQLREDAQDEMLAMPRDLDGDGQVDSLDHRSDALLVPVCVRVEWQLGKSARQLEMHAVFADQ